MTRATDEWFGKTDDSAIPPRVRLRIFERAGGRCTMCTRKVHAGQFEFDHQIALCLGGQHKESNLFLVCKECHSGKTVKDVAAKSKVYRMGAKHRGIKKPRTIRSWRKFSGEIVHASRER